MRLNHLAALGLALLAAASACAPPIEGLVHINPTTEERELFHNFGPVEYGVRLNHTFQFKNTERRPVTFLSSQGACTCTALVGIEATDGEGGVVRGDPTANKGMLTVAPGEVASLEIRVDTTKIAANQHKLAVMRVSTDSSVNPFMTLELHVYAEKLFRIHPEKLTLGACPQGSGGEAWVDITLAGPESPCRVVGIEKNGRWVDANLETIEVAGQPAWRLAVKLPALTNLGPIQDEIVLKTTDRDGNGADERLTVPVHGQVVADIAVFPETLSFGMLKAGESGELEAQVLARVPGARVKILGAEIDGPLAEHVELEYRPIRGDAVGRSKEWRIHMKAAGSIPVGRATGTLNIQLDDAQYPELSAKVLAVVR